MKRRFAYNIKDNYKKIRIEEDYFKGYVCVLKFENIEKPLIVYNGKENICIKDNNYEWIEVYPDRAKYAITIMYDNNKDIIEWYFDISKRIGIENGIPFEDDLYLDLLITADGQKIILDENELIDALKIGDINQQDVDNAYETLYYLENKYYNNFEELIRLTEYLVNKVKNLI